MAPSRLAANAVAEEATSLKRCAKIRLARNTGVNPSAEAARKRGITGRLSSDSWGTIHVTTSEASSAP